MLGHISFWNNIRGFGFITVTRKENDATIHEQFFFHNSNFKRGETPVLNGIVIFGLGEPVAIGKKVQAVAIRYATPQEIAGHNGGLIRQGSIAALLSGDGGAA
jgi:cold shock CspA family protein